ncbi:MAG: ATP-binding cassette domain-containing protein [Acidimicrobiales bacterium]
MAERVVGRRVAYTEAVPRRPRELRRLDAHELADAAMAAALATGLVTFGRLLAAGTFFQILATVVWAALAARRRPRVVVMGTAATMTLALLLGGIGPVSQAFVAGLFGLAAGPGLRHRHGLVRHVLRSIVIAWPVVAGATVGFLALFVELRELSFENGRNQWLGMANLLERAGFDETAERGTTFVDWSIEHWWLMVPLLQLAITVGYALLVRRLGRLVVDRIDRALGPASTAATPEPVSADPVAATEHAPTEGPLPITLDHPSIRRGIRYVELDVATTIHAGDGLVVTGPNGAGKSSLYAAIAGLVPSTGIEMAGRPGLGAAGGTAWIGQRPETQVVGIRVIDDVRWGAPPGIDVQPALDAVGLGDKTLDTTGTLSGGELQRLAIAAAMVRRPSLVLSDESTSMLDPAGRHEVLALLSTMRTDGATVLHSTHLADELDLFPRRLHVERPGAAHRGAPPVPRRAPRASRREPRLMTYGVGHVYGVGTPWERRVLAGVDLTVAPGEVLVVAGPNGSGKSTLARILAGLIRPSEGEVVLADKALSGPNRRIGIAFQHARLQLLRSTVGAEVRSAAGTTMIDEALRLVGFDPTTIADRRIDELSGGETRRVLIAGLVARGCDTVILDEPLAGLDEQGRDDLLAVTEHLLARGTAIVVVSHDPTWGADLADWLVTLEPVADEPSPIRTGA